MVCIQISIQTVAVSFCQDTAVALQALAAYSEATAGREQINLHVEVFTDRAGAFKKTLIINQKNALIQQQLDVGCKKYNG